VTVPLSTARATNRASTSCAALAAHGFRPEAAFASGFVPAVPAAEPREVSVMKKLLPVCVLSLVACATGTHDYGWGDSPASQSQAGIVVTLPHALGGGTRTTQLTSNAPPLHKYPLGLVQSTKRRPPVGGAGEITPQVLPQSVDLSQSAPPPGDQGQTGSCATFATGYSAMGWWDARTGLGGGPYAPMFLYAQQVQGDCSAGTAIEDDLDIMKAQGIDTAADYEPMEQDLDCATQPSPQNLAVAAHYKILDYENPDLSDPKAAIMQELSAGRPVVLGIEVYSNFMNADSQSYLIGAPSPGDYSEGGHGITAFKYDANGVWILNSWGTSWGLGGWGELSWDFITGQNCLDDVAAITGVVGGSPSPVPPPPVDAGAPDAAPPPVADAGPAPTPTPTPGVGPQVTFLSPAGGSTLSAGDPFSVVVSVSDQGATVTDVALVWISAQGDSLYELGDLGNGQSGIDLDLSSSAQPGLRTLTVIATDSNGQSGNAAETLQVQ
jgi:hypothetical protein